MEQRTVITIPFSAGIQQRGDDRAQDPPALAICKDAEFDDIGGLRTRKPYANVGTSILGGGTISNPRKVVANGTEPLLFTDTSLYAWSARDSKWVLRDTHLAVAMDEKDVFNVNGDQTYCDRAQLSNTVVYAWANGGYVYIAASDATTGAVICAPTVVNGGSAAAYPRLIALQTKILLFYDDNATDLKAIAIDPANVSGSVIPGTTILTTFNHYYDVCSVPSSDTCVVAAKHTTTTNYKVAKVTSGLAVTSATKARTCDGPIAVAVNPSATVIQVIRGNGTNIQGDSLVYSSLADTTTGQAVGTVGTSVLTIGCNYRSVQNSGKYRCYVFWGGYTAGYLITKYNWVDDGGTLGSEGTFLRQVDIASKPFDYNGSIYVWVAQSTPTEVDTAAYQVALQNTYYLYRDDGFLASQCAAGRAAGYPSSGGADTGYVVLPGVQLVSGTTGYAWCAGVQRQELFAASAVNTFSARAPSDALFTFDDNRARRCVRLGKTMYIAGGLPLAYDGVSLAEVNFLVQPNKISLSASTGSIADGTYGYKSTWRWANAQGEVDRSSTVATYTETSSGGPKGFQAVGIPLFITRKTTNPPAWELWRTAASPTVDSPFYLVTSQDPSNSTDPNRYIGNDTSGNTLASIRDALADASLTINTPSPENGAALAPMAPPSANIIAASDDRIFLAGIANRPDEVWYSKQRSPGEVAAFNGDLTIQVPRAGGNITALAFLNETLVVFRERAIYAFPGDGYDNTGGGSNYGPARIISQEIGAENQESVALISAGLLFSSSKGWYVLNRGWGLDYVGAPVSNYDSETPVAVQVVGGQQQVRVATGNRVLVWDTLVNQWGEWTISGVLGATLLSGTYYYVTSAGVFAEQADFSGGVTYGMDIETAWIKPAQLVGQCKIRWIMPLGEYRSACSLRIRVARNYQSDGAGGWTYFDDVYRDPATTVGGPVQVRMGPSIKGMEAVKIRLTASNTAKNGTAPPGEALKLTGIGLEVGLQPGLYKLLPQTQKGG